MSAEPIPMRLTCPDCGQLHIDEGEFATKPHHTHACQHCGHVWRPALVPTVGVRFLPGFKNSPGPLPASQPGMGTTEPTPGDSPHAPERVGLGEDLIAERARLLREATAERINDANAADYVGAPYRDGFPSRERVALWNREWLEHERRQQQASLVGAAPAMPRERALELVEAYMLRGERPAFDMLEVLQALRR